MAVTQYIGARYVPLLMGEWDNTRAYEPLSIVQYMGASYTSKQAVPIGAAILDSNYWVMTGNYNAQVEQYRQEVLRFDSRITDVEEVAESANTTAQNAERIASAVELNSVMAPEPFGAVKALGRTQGGCVVDNILYTITATDDTNVCVMSTTGLDVLQTSYKTLPAEIYHGNCLTYLEGNERFYITDYSTSAKTPGDWSLKEYDGYSNNVVATTRLRNNMPLVIVWQNEFYGVYSETTWDKEFTLCKLDSSYQPAEPIAHITTPEIGDSRGFLPSGLCYIEDIHMFCLSLYDADHNYFAFIEPVSGAVTFAENTAFGETQFIAPWRGQLLGGVNLRSLGHVMPWQHIVAYSYRGGSGARYFINNRTYQGATIYLGERPASDFKEDGSEEFPFADGCIFQALASTQNVTMNLVNDIDYMIYTGITNYLGINLNGHRIRNCYLIGRSITIRIDGKSDGERGKINLVPPLNSDGTPAGNYGMILYNCATQIIEADLTTQAGIAPFRVRGGAISVHNEAFITSDKTIPSQVYEGAVAHLTDPVNESWDTNITVYGSFFNGEWSQGARTVVLPTP